MKKSTIQGLKKSLDKGLIVLFRDIFRACKKNVVGYINKQRVKGKQKIFCIGRNKTGTTSIKVLFQDLGMVVGIQMFAERLQPYYLKGDFEPIIEYCKSAQFFQDYPFSYPETYKHMDKAYPGSKFILTVRDDAEQWYNSLIKFHSNLFGNGKIPTAQNLKDSTNVYKGWIWNNYKYLYNSTEENPYDKQKFIESYTNYNNSVIEYFKDRPDDLIVINVSKKGDFGRLIKFLNIKTSIKEFPWENKTSEIKRKKK